MLRCRDVARLASDYINGDLSWRQRLAIRAHLLMCRHCSRYLLQMRQAVALVRRLGRSGRTSRRPADAEEDARSIFRAARTAPDGSRRQDR
ncbi:MAG: zf-HC2 domain-containing protein [Acidobacteria bacterium]|nr:zf-HC2 domain-containing protein [Acidobacteriota bacterium]